MRVFALRGLAFRRVDDETLLRRARSGDEGAFAELYRRFRTLVHGYCLARLMDPHAAEDVTQEVFVRIGRSGSDEEVRSAKAWVFSVARSAIVDHVRRQRRRPESVAVDDDFDVAARDSDAATGMLRREDARAVFLALARLRPRYRSALVLREMHGLSSVEIGEAMGLKPGAVDTLVCRARDAFGREYAAVGDLPSECRRAVEYLYRERGTGLPDAERAWLDDHVARCRACARERSLASDASRLAFLLPLVGGRGETLSILHRAWEALGSAPASADAVNAVAVKVSAAAIATVVVMTPAAATNVTRTEPPARTARVEAAVPAGRRVSVAPARRDEPVPAPRVPAMDTGDAPELAADALAATRSAAPTAAVAGAGGSSRNGTVPPEPAAKPPSPGAGICSTTAAGVGVPAGQERARSERPGADCGPPGVPEGEPATEASGTAGP